MLKEYQTVSNIAGPLILVEDVADARFGEIVSIELADGSLRNGQILEVDRGNALVQAREFGKVCRLTGLILTKIDGTGKGGVAVSIREELGYPIRFVGLGEKTADLQPFDPKMFADALFQG